MQVYDGFKITGKEEDKIIMEKTFGENGRIVFVANPSPDAQKKQQVINEAGKILLKNLESHL